MSEQLKKCPWHDSNCVFEVSFHIPRCTNKRELIRAWNRRKTDD